MLVSGVQRSDSVMNIYVPFHILFQYRLFLGSFYQHLTCFIPLLVYDLHLLEITLTRAFIMHVPPAIFPELRIVPDTE